VNEDKREEESGEDSYYYEEEEENVKPKEYVRTRSNIIILSVAKGKERIQNHKRYAQKNRYAFMLLEDTYSLEHMIQSIFTKTKYLFVCFMTNDIIFNMKKPMSIERIIKSNKLQVQQTGYCDNLGSYMFIHKNIYKSNKLNEITEYETNTFFTKL
jgi:hypothetical protein